MAILVAAIDQDLWWYLTLVGLTVAMCVGVVWVHRIWSDLKGDAVDRLTGPEDLLGPLSEAFAAGQMSESEYLRIKESIRRAGPAGHDLNPGVSARPTVERPEAEKSARSTATDEESPETRA
jgi:hypothetical protein